MGRNRVFTRTECEAFVDAANPYQWLLSAESLHRQALALWRNKGNGQIAFTREGQPTLTWDFTNRSTYLLAAFAMENMLKSFLVYEHPEYVADGYLTASRHMTYQILPINHRSFPIRLETVGYT